MSDKTNCPECGEPLIELDFDTLGDEIQCKCGVRWEVNYDETEDDQGQFWLEKNLEVNKGEYREVDCPYCGKTNLIFVELVPGLMRVTCGWCERWMEFGVKVPPEPDICARKHGGNPESVEANAHTDKNMGRRRVIEWMEARGAQGDITYGIAKALGMPYTTASARVSELRKMGVLIPKPKPGGGYFRDKTPTGSSAAILILKEYAPLEFDKKGQSKLF